MNKNKLGYYKNLDSKAKHIARFLVYKKKQSITTLLLKYISDFYKLANLEKNLFVDKNFKSSYHQPITNDLEFLIARILYHFSNKKNFGWIIYLRCQIKKKIGNKSKMVVPDIRIEKIDKYGKKITLGIIEIKAKIGWNQDFYAPGRFNSNLKKFKEGKTNFNPIEKNKESEMQFEKYRRAFGIDKSKIFVLLPSISAAYRVKDNKNIFVYEKHFLKYSRLKKENFILLSENPRLDLAKADFKRKDFQASKRFENFIIKINGN